MGGYLTEAGEVMVFYILRTCSFFAGIFTLEVGFHPTILPISNICLPFFPTLKPFSCFNV